MYKSITHFAIAILCFFAVVLQGQKISIQSTLKDITGKAIPDGDVNVVFRLYNTITGGNAVWEESTTVTVVGGIYSHKLGSVNALIPANFGNTLYLGVTVAGGQELAPRTELTSAPYAVSVGSLAANGGSASFDSGGKFYINGGAKIAGHLGIALPGGDPTYQLSLLGNHGMHKFGDNLALINNGSARMSMWDNGNTSFDATGNNEISFWNNGTQRFRVENGGTVTTGYHSVYGDLNIANNGNISMGGTGNINMTGGNLNISNGANSSNVTRWVTLGDSDTGLRSSTDGELQLMSNNHPVASLKNGRMGINTANPLAPLHVTWENGNFGQFSGSSSDYTGLSFYNEGGMHWVNGSTYHLLGDPSGNGPALTHIGIISDGSIVSRKGLWSCNTLTISDKRIKNIVGLSNSSQDLKLLNKIKITDYVMKDRVQDNNKYKKVIAQDIQEIFPQAVTRSRNVLPDIFAQPILAKFEDNKIVISMEKEHGLITGDHVDVLSKEAKLTDIEVIDVFDNKTFTISSEKELTKIFVYGKYVNDFLGVDYDAISMLNVSATQELYKKILDLENENKALKTNTTNLEERMARIEAMIGSTTQPSQNTNTLAGQK